MAHELYFALTFAPMIAAVVVLAVLFLPSFYRGLAVVDVRQFGTSLARALRLAGFLVAERPSHLAVHVGPLMMLKVHVAPDPRGTAVRFQADFTSGGWSLVVILIVLGAWIGPAIAAIVFTVFAFLSIRSVALRRIVPFLAPGGLPPVGTTDDARVLLAEGLSEAERLASEAYAATTSTFWNAELILLLAALGLWSLVFFGGVAAASPAFPDLADLAIRAFAYASVFSSAMAPLVWRWFLPRRTALRTWADRLRAAWRDLGFPAQEGGSTAFEVLVEASREVPGWVDAARKGSFLRDPRAHLLPMVLAFSGFWIVWTSAWFSLWEPTRLAGLVALGLGIAMILVAGVWFYRWKRRFAEEARRSLVAWHERFDVLRARMERFLEDL